VHIEIREITAIPEELADQMRSLYEKSFHPEETRDWAGMTESLGSDDIGRTRMTLATRDHTVMGLSIFRYHPEQEFGYLWYLCVDESTRGAGVGGKLFCATVDALTAAARENGLRIKGMMFEISRLDSESDPVYGDPHRRLKFYERLGARMILGYDYYQPPIPPYPDNVPLELMFRPIDMPESTCTPDELATLVRDFVLHCQGQAAQVDPAQLRLKRAATGHE
jgi:GNAT superfamily N-acetyltransferase